VRRPRASWRWQRVERGQDAITGMAGGGAWALSRECSGGWEIKRGDM
jgi:hypothetical protein